ncbi:asparagine synthase (glutamine-hydrolyzing) [Nocardia vinacea]|uniref:asparagine synthase (glutamine-hydrolyzing) n=1 Tax=Nocardia vinacea TaxID=96468 RepID=UPI0002F460C3|nr:asparagine synthase (glutamine-hydrolyzing) [Nocardia vinacea]
MCGIVGGIGELRPFATSAMLSSIAHRGPDGTGLHIKPNVSVGAARLAIVDIEGGAQPIYSSDGRHCIVFNGEIYNHQQLRASLQRRGRHFRSVTDGEVVLQQFLEYGPQGLRELSGMYAFCITGPDWLFLARDPLGIKPLYIYRSPDARTLLFSSEIKALLQSPVHRPSVDMTAIADWLLVGHPCGDRTFVEQVRAVPPGTGIRATIHAGELRYEHISTTENVVLNVAEGRDSVAEKVFEQELVSAVRTHIEADVEVGIALSGGIDSSLLAAMAPQRLRSFTVAEREDDGDLTGARAIARSLRLDHHEHLINTQDYFDNIVRSVLIEEQPAALGGLPLYFLCLTMSRHVKCAVIGEGADELFGGYREYMDPALYLDDSSSRLRMLADAGLRPSDDALELVEMKAAAGPDRDRRVHAFHANLGNTLVRRHLEVVDKYSMAVGLELRVPYLDNAVYQSAMAVPVGAKVDVESRTQKVLLRELLQNRLGASAASVLRRRKQGFPASGVRHAASFARYCECIVSDDYIKAHPLGVALPTKYMLVMYDLFEELMLRNAGCRPVGFDLAEFIRLRSTSRQPTGA